MVTLFFWLPEGELLLQECGNVVYSSIFNWVMIANAGWRHVTWVSHRCRLEADHLGDGHQCQLVHQSEFGPFELGIAESMHLSYNIIMFVDIVAIEEIIQKGVDNDEVISTYLSTRCVGHIQTKPITHLV